MKMGKMRRVVVYKNGNLDGRELTYWKNGKPRRIDYFKNGEFIKGKCFNADGNPVSHTPFERNPEFPGGDAGLMNYLRMSVKYPEDARKKGISGKVVVQFVIDTNGYVTNVRIAQGVSKELDKEAMEVIKTMPKWKPGILFGEPVSVQYSLPIQFSL